MPASLKDFNFTEVYNKWQNLARQYSCFVHTTSFTTLKNYPNFVLNTFSSETNIHMTYALKFANQYADRHTLFFIDMPITSALKYAYYFNRELDMLPVLTIRNLHHPYGIVGDKESISALLSYPDLIKDVSVKFPNYLFVLDSNRSSDFTEDIYKIQFNNQYQLTEFNLPTQEMLKENGINRIVFLYGKALKEDILNYRESLIENKIDVIDFDLLSNKESSVTVGAY